MAQGDPYADQSHHLVTFVQIGYQKGAHAGYKFVHQQDSPNRTNPNVPDILLGYVGVDAGVSLQEMDWNASNANHFMSTLVQTLQADPNRVPGQPARRLP